MEKVCRLCLRKEESKCMRGYSVAHIFYSNVTQKLPAQHNRNAFQISKDDMLPKLICKECARKIETFYNFRQQCKESDCILREHYKVTFDIGFHTDKNRICQDVYVQTDITNSSIEMRKPLSKQVKKKLKQDNFNMHFNSNDDHNQDNIVINNSSHSDDTNSNIADGQSSLNINGKMQVKDKWKASMRDSQLVCTRKSNRLKNRQDHTCNFCQKVCISKKALLEHAKLHVGQEKTKYKCNRVYKCKVCTMPFKEKFKLNLHLRIHGKELPIKSKKQYLCDICSKTFASKSGLRLHLKLHNGSKPYACKLCGKSFATLSYKIRHERTHTGDKHFVCHICSAAYASSNGFKYHLRVHTGEANYHCEICGKSFRRQKYLKEHTFTHTGEKPFVCKICGSAYGNSGSLFVHEKKCKSRNSHDNPVFVKKEHE